MEFLENGFLRVRATLGWVWIWWPFVNSLAPSSPCSVTHMAVSLGPRGLALSDSQCLVLSYLFSPSFSSQSGLQASSSTKFWPWPFPRGLHSGSKREVSLMWWLCSFLFCNFAYKAQEHVNGEQGLGSAWSSQWKEVAPACLRPCWRYGALPAMGRSASGQLWVPSGLYVVQRLLGEFTSHPLPRRPPSIGTEQTGSHPLQALRTAPVWNTWSVTLVLTPLFISGSGSLGWIVLSGSFQYENLNHSRLVFPDLCYSLPKNYLRGCSHLGTFSTLRRGSGRIFWGTWMLLLEAVKCFSSIREEELETQACRNFGCVCFEPWVIPRHQCMAWVVLEQS